MTMFRPMTDLERRAARAMSPGRITYPVASPPKRFARSIAAQAEGGMSGEPRITDKQAALLWAIVWRFRRQVNDRELLAFAQRERERREGKAVPA